MNIQIKNERKGSTTSLKRQNPEHIKELETSRSNKDVHICECPPVDPNGQPDLNEDCIVSENGSSDS